MSDFRSLSGERLIKTLKKQGFVVIRIRGSHHFLRNPAGRCTVVPVHRGETVGPGLLAQILRDCDLTKEELRSVL